MPRATWNSFDATADVAVVIGCGVGLSVDSDSTEIPTTTVEGPT